ncbi:MAG: hypothetical protein QOC94_1700 [Actinoplanes sp.]|nr:hypothetical protein [Actinoplanes sp.]
MAVIGGPGWAGIVEIGGGPDWAGIVEIGGGPGWAGIAEIGGVGAGAAETGRSEGSSGVGSAAFSSRTIEI